MIHETRGGYIWLESTVKVKLESKVDHLPPDEVIACSDGVATTYERQMQETLSLQCQGIHNLIQGLSFAHMLMSFP